MSDEEKTAMENTHETTPEIEQAEIELGANTTAQDYTQKNTQKTKDVTTSESADASTQVHEPVNRQVNKQATTPETVQKEPQDSKNKVAFESPLLKEYFNRIDHDLQNCYKIASAAREQGYDPEERVDLPLARDMAERVEGLMSIVAPQLVGKGVPARIKELEAQYNKLSWRVALLIAEEVAKEKFCKFKDKKEAMEIGIRTGFAYHTVGVVAAPLEGFIELKIKKRDDGKEYIAACYAGPIRGAGGTAASFSVLLTDYVRKRMGYAPYDPNEKEIKRYATEIRDYHERVTNLQYFPSEDEIKFYIKNLPIEIDGDPTEKLDVSNYKDLPRIETNKIRGGICLVLAEGLCQKSPKLWKRLSQWGKDFDMEQWAFIEDFLKLQKEIKAGKGAKKSGGEKKSKRKRVSPNNTFVKDIIAGRPIFTHPLCEGGFRLRYGRTRISGFSVACMTPITTYFLENFIATGTQLKNERPGKGCTITPCDCIDGPLIRLKNGDVVKPKPGMDLKALKNELETILYLGDILFSYGDFSENGHMLCPCGYCQEWFVQELEQAAMKNQDVDSVDAIDFAALAQSAGIDETKITDLFKNPLFATLSVEEAFTLARKLSVPLHPDQTFFWDVLTVDDLKSLLKGLFDSATKREDCGKIIFKFDPELKVVLEKLGVPHTIASNEFMVVADDEGKVLIATLSLDTKSHEDLLKIIDEESVAAVKEEFDLLEDRAFVIPRIVSRFCGITIRPKAGTPIGARMGRPEKAKMRKLAGSPQVLFPVGEEGSRMRSFQAAIGVRKITSDFPVNFCEKCDKETILGVCEVCGTKTIKKYYCSSCGTLDKECDHEPKRYKQQSVPIVYYMDHALKQIKERLPPLVKGVKGTSNQDHIPEHLAKGVLRAKHNVYVNKDGTTRYDMTELPITHFIPAEISTPVEKLKELGYKHDIDGNELTDENQVVEMYPQDLILPCNKTLSDEPCDEVLFRVGNFVDDLLIRLYGQKSFYNFKSKQDVIGHLVIGLAPHISAGIVGRVIGFSQTQGMLSHPMFHAAMRRDCDGDEACVILLMDAALNFSRQFLPNRRGSRTMDAPLTVTGKLIPSEVDDQVHGLDVCSRYPLEMYEAAWELKMPWEFEKELKARGVKIPMDTIKVRLNTPGQYEGMKYTHPLSDINLGVHCSDYKNLPSMTEKIEGQMKLARIIRAVDEAKVAGAVIEKHFMKDIKGNLRKYSQQEFRCVACNQKFRRLPLLGKCTKCSGKIIFTISEGSVIKYLGPSLKLSEEYAVPEYLKQTLEIVRRQIEGVFGREKEVQTALGGWVK